MYDRNTLRSRELLARQLSNLAHPAAHVLSAFVRAAAVTMIPSGPSPKAGAFVALGAFETVVLRHHALPRPGVLVSVFEARYHAVSGRVTMVPVVAYDPSLLYPDGPAVPFGSELGLPFNPVSDPVTARAASALFHAVSDYDPAVVVSSPPVPEYWLGFAADNMPSPEDTPAFREEAERRGRTWEILLEEGDLTVEVAMTPEGHFVPVADVAVGNGDGFFKVPDGYVCYTLVPQRFLARDPAHIYATHPVTGESPPPGSPHDGELSQGGVWFGHEGLWVPTAQLPDVVLMTAPVFGRALRNPASEVLTVHGLARPETVPKDWVRGATSRDWPVHLLGFAAEDSQAWAGIVVEAAAECVAAGVVLTLPQAAALLADPSSPLEDPCSVAVAVVRLTGPACPETMTWSVPGVDFNLFCAGRHDVDSGHNPKRKFRRGHREPARRRAGGA